MFHRLLLALATLGSLSVDDMLYATGVATFGKTTITTQGRALMDDVGASNQRTTMGLGALAILNTVNNGEWSGTDLSVANGGTGSSNASDARTALGVAIGSHVQAFGAILDDLNTLGAPATDGQFIVATGGGAFAYESGSAARSSLSLGTGDNPSFATPTLDAHAATKGYVDSVAEGLNVKGSVRAATTGALPAVSYANGTAGVGATLTGGENGALAAQDGVTLLINERILVKNQAAGLQNGIYSQTQVGTGGVPFILTRVGDSDEAAEVDSAFCFVQEGSTFADNGFVMTTDGSITMGSTALNWTQFSGAGQITAGTGLTKSGSTINVIGGEGILANADDVAINWEGTSTNVKDISATASQGVGSTIKAARSDHQHAILTAAAVRLSGTATAVGVSASMARADHQHGTAPAADGTVFAANGTAWIYEARAIRNQGVVKTSTGAIADADGRHVEVDVAASGQTITLPSLATHRGEEYVIWNLDAVESFNLARAGSDTILGFPANLIPVPPQTSVRMIAPRTGTIWIPA